MPGLKVVSAHRIALDGLRFPHHAVGGFGMENPGQHAAMQAWRGQKAKSALFLNL
jgi:hypothetical protein